MWLNGHIFCGFKLNYTNYKLVNLYMCVDQMKKKKMIIIIRNNNNFGMFEKWNESLD